MLKREGEGEGTVDFTTGIGYWVLPTISDFFTFILSLFFIFAKVPASVDDVVVSLVYHHTVPLSLVFLFLTFVMVVVGLFQVFGHFSSYLLLFGILAKMIFNIGITLHFRLCDLKSIEVILKFVQRQSFWSFRKNSLLKNNQNDKNTHNLINN